MTKNNALRLGSVMLVLALLSSCALWGTFAKYTTSSEAATDTATVAKWGVEVTAPTDVAGFSQTYAFDDTETTLTGNSVVKSENALAPGTKGDGTAATIKGTPEVAVKVTMEDSTIELSGWSVDSADYVPLVVTVGGTVEDDGSITGGTVVDGTATATNTMATFKAAVDKVFDDFSKEYAAGTDLSTKASEMPAVHWKWAFEGNDDAKDTKLGDAGSATVTFNLTTKVTQID